MRHAGFILLLLALTTSNAHGFLGPGHEAIADVAQDRLSLTTQAALGRILQNTSSLSPGALKGVATWLDDVRNRAVHGKIAPGWSPDDVQEADDFNQNHPRNSEWHFVNLPLGAAAYPNDPVPAGNPLTPRGSRAPASARRRRGTRCERISPLAAPRRRAARRRGRPR